jgi:4'-phosphopantetheinyl transferase
MANNPGIADSGSVRNNPKPRLDAAVAGRVDRPPPALAADEVWVWLADLRQSPDRLAELAATLTADERARAARFRFPDQHDRFVAGRGMLRELVGAYAGRSAAALRFEAGLHGKPTLGGADAGAGLHFNLAHSGDWALYAVAQRELGVDLECHDRRVNHAAIAERISTPREWAAFQTVPADRLENAFFTCWTRKEAIAKALGSGLASGLRNLEVGFPEAEALNRRITLTDPRGREWSVLTLSLGLGWSAALAAVGADWRWRGGHWG